MKKGFTLIELVVGVSVLAILSAIIVPNIMDLVVQARNSFRANSLGDMETALAQYKLDNAEYPYGWGWRGEYGYGNRTHEGWNAYIPNFQNYMRRLPADPTAGKINPAVWNRRNNGFLYLSNRQYFKLLSHYGPENPGSRYGDEKWKYYDPNRRTWAWAVYAPGSRNW